MFNHLDLYSALMATDHEQGMFFSVSHLQMHRAFSFRRSASPTPVADCLALELSLTKALELSLTKALELSLTKALELSLTKALELSLTKVSRGRVTINLAKKTVFYNI